MAKQMDLKALLESKLSDIKPAEDTQESIETVENAVPKNLMFDAESSEFKPETKAVSVSEARGLTVDEAKQFDDDMSRFIDAVLIAGVDYGVIPHCSKPTLLKPGAEKIMNYLGLIARTEVVNRMEDYNDAFFSYECKVFLIDYNGVVKGEGVGIANTKESKYAKQNGFSVQNVVLKMSKKRALVDAVLNVGSLSARFTQDVEDLNIESNTSIGRSVEDPKRDNTSSSYSNMSGTSRPATQKQIRFLESLMEQHGVTVGTVNKYIQSTWNIDNYRKVSGVQASALIERLKSCR